MAFCCDIERKKLENRINRIAGQVNSIKKKFNDKEFSLDSDPYETIRQLSAIKGAVNGMIMSYIEHYAKGHMIEKIKTVDNIESEAIIDNLLEVMKFGR